MKYKTCSVALPLHSPHNLNTWPMYIRSASSPFIFTTYLPLSDHACLSLVHCLFTSCLLVYIIFTMLVHSLFTAWSNHLFTACPPHSWYLTFLFYFQSLPIPCMGTAPVCIFNIIPFNTLLWKLMSHSLAINQRSRREQKKGPIC